MIRTNRPADLETLIKTNLRTADISDARNPNQFLWINRITSA